MMAGTVNEESRTRPPSRSPSVGSAHSTTLEALGHQRPGARSPAAATGQGAVGGEEATATPVAPTVTTHRPRRGLRSYPMLTPAAGLQVARLHRSRSPYAPAAWSLTVHHERRICEVWGRHVSRLLEMVQLLTSCHTMADSLYLIFAQHWGRPERLPWGLPAAALQVIDQTLRGLQLAAVPEGLADADTRPAPVPIEQVWRLQAGRLVARAIAARDRLRVARRQMAALVLDLSVRPHQVCLQFPATRSVSGPVQRS